MPLLLIPVGNSSDAGGSPALGDVLMGPCIVCFLPAVMRTGESGLTVFRLLTKDKRWKWVQANARLVYKNGKPEYILVTQRPLV